MLNNHFSNEIFDTNNLFSLLKDIYSFESFNYPFLNYFKKRHILHAEKCGNVNRCYELKSAAMIQCSTSCTSTPVIE